jgi:hypothetical protein
VYRGAGAGAARRPRRTVAALTPPKQLIGHRMRGAVSSGTGVSDAGLFTDRVFANPSDGFALVNDGSAQYPARSRDGGRSWQIDGPQFHVDAADGPEGVGYVGVVGPRTFFAYGSSVVDISTDAGRRGWEAYLGELVVAVVPGPGDVLVAYIQQQLSNTSIASAATWKYGARRRAPLALRHRARRAQRLIAANPIRDGRIPAL